MKTVFLIALFTALTSNAQAANWSCDSGYRADSLHGGRMVRLTQNANGRFSLSYATSKDDVGHGSKQPPTIVATNLVCKFAKATPASVYCMDDSDGTWLTLDVSFDRTVSMTGGTEGTSESAAVILSSPRLESIFPQGVLRFNVLLSQNGKLRKDNTCGFEK